MRRRYRRLPAEVRAEIIGLAREGLTRREILERVDISAGALSAVLRPFGGVFRDRAPESARGFRLGVDDRIEIAVGLSRGESMRSIAARLGRAGSTVSREVNANGGPGDYRPAVAQDRARDGARRPKVTKLAASPELLTRVGAGPKGLWAPAQIAGVP